MWLQLRMYLLVGLLVAILYGIIAGIVYILGVSESTYYILIIAIAILIIIAQYIMGPKTIEYAMKVKHVKESENHRLHQIINELSTKAGIPKPKVGMSKLKIPNAFAYGRTRKTARVCVTEDLLNILNEDQLKAVLGHEISHIKHRDVIIITMLSVVPMICYMIYITFLWGGLFSRGQRNNGGMFIIGILALGIYFLSSLLVMYGSRIREYQADIGSVDLGNQPHHLATALYKLVYGSARADKNTINKSAGMKAFFLNDPSRAVYDIKELKDLDLDMSGTIDQNELLQLSSKKVRISKSEKIIEMLSSHPHMVLRIKHLSSLT